MATSTDTMRAVRLVAWGQAPELVEIPVPEPGPGQARVRVAGCGLCHSDLAMMAMPADLAESLGWHLPFTLGHETAGYVDAWGTDVGGFVEGQPVALASPTSCGLCRWCRRGMENACPSGTTGRGYGRDGGLADYVLVDQPERSLIPLGTLDPRVAGPLTDAGATAHHAVARVAPRVGDDAAVVVVGAGGMGRFVVQLVRRLTNARVVAVDTNADRRDEAVGLGAHAAVDNAGRGAGRRIVDAADGRPIDAVVDLVGTDDTIGLAASVLAPAGALAVVGAAGGRLNRPWFGGLPRDAEVFTFQGSDLADVRSVVALAAAGDLRLDVVPFTLEQTFDAYRALEAGTLTGRAVVQPLGGP
ncbi:MAG: alcohol dehydrogenase catalytic domain-containing protein [Aquihabitans sp.]